MLGDREGLREFARRRRGWGGGWWWGGGGGSLLVGFSLAAPCQGLAALFQTEGDQGVGLCGQSGSPGCELGALLRGVCSKWGCGSLTLGVLSSPEPL